MAFKILAMPPLLCCHTPFPALLKTESACLLCKVIVTKSGLPLLCSAWKVGQPFFLVANHYFIVSLTQVYCHTIVEFNPLKKGQWRAHAHQPGPGLAMPCSNAIVMRHLRCVVSPPIMITKCTHGEHGNYDLTIIILWNDHYDFNFNVGMSDDSKKWKWETWLSILSCIDC